ncbi:unnamed protein product [Boreogadus saida]
MMKFKVETVKWAWPSGRNGFGFFVCLKMLLSLEGAASNKGRAFDARKMRAVPLRRRWVKAYKAFTHRRRSGASKSLPP